MALSAVVAAITTSLRAVPGAITVPETPPPQLPYDRMILVYPHPGGSLPFQHGGRGGQAVVAYRDEIVVEWHLKVASDQIDAFLAISTPLLDEVRDRLWSDFVRTRFDGTVVALHGVNTDTYGEMGWSSEFTYGFRLILDITHAAELTAGKVTP